jgi:hypothetical protein
MIAIRSGLGARCQEYMAIREEILRSFDLTVFRLKEARPQDFEHEYTEYAQIPRKLERLLGMFQQD